MRKLKARETVGHQRRENPHGPERSERGIALVQAKYNFIRPFQRRNQIAEERAAFEGHATNIVLNRRVIAMEFDAQNIALRKGVGPELRRRQGRPDQRKRGKQHQRGQVTGFAGQDGTSPTAGSRTDRMGRPVDADLFQRAAPYGPSPVRLERWNCRNTVNGQVSRRFQRLNPHPSGRRRLPPLLRCNQQALRDAGKVSCSAAYAVNFRRSLPGKMLACSTCQTLPGAMFMINDPHRMTAARFRHCSGLQLCLVH